jgi:hypothetical protein
MGHTHTHSFTHSHKYNHTTAVQGSLLKVAALRSGPLSMLFAYILTLDPFACNPKKLGRVFSRG